MRAVLVVWLIFSAGSARAEWIEFAKSSTGDIFFVDFATFRKGDGDIRRIWALVDLKKDGPYRESSRRFLTEYDCKKERSRELASTAFLGTQARGDSVWSRAQPSDWEYPAPDTIGAALLKFVCTS